MSDEFLPCEGGCICGYLRYRMTIAPLIVHACHCRRCQRQSGSAFALNALVEADRVVLLSGVIEDIAVPAPTGGGQRVARCPKCKVAVWSNYLSPRSRAGELVRFVRVGTLDEPDRMPPDIHIYISTKQPWFDLPQGARAVSEYYDMNEVWAPDSLERRRMMLQAMQETP